MPSTAEGIEQAAPEENVNSEAGFAAALAGKGVEPEAGDEHSTDTSIASGLEVVEPDQPRTPTGQFAPKETVQEESETSTATEEIDPLVAEYLAKYDGDPEKAIKAAAHQQRLIGEQGSKLGEQAERLARLEGLVEGIGKRPETAAPTLSVEQVEEQAASLIAAGGYDDAATKAANIALQTGDDRVYGEVIDSWSLESGYQAAKHVANFEAWKAQQNVPQHGSDPWVEQQKNVAQMGATLTTVAKERGATWAQIAPHMEKALEGLPEQVAALVSSEDAALRLAGTRIVADRATLLAGAAEQAAPTAEAGIPPSVARKLGGAGVATGALRPPAKGVEGKTQTVEEAKAEFKRAILEVETTDIASGLTYAK